MPSKTTWAEAKVKLGDYLADSKYEPVRPLLDSLLPLVNAKTGTPEAVDALLEIADTLLIRQAQDGDAKELAEELARGSFTGVGAVEGDMFNANRDIIVNIIGDFKDKIKDQAIRVDIVTLAMVAGEVATLADKTAFADHPDVLRENFQNLNALLDAEFGDWAAHYGKKRQDWQPFGSGSNKTIGRYIKDALDERNQIARRRSSTAPEFRARFHDICELDTGNASSRALLVDLRTKGCVMIVDTVSMRHPTLIRAFHRAMLDVFPNTSVVSLAPGGQILGVTKQMVQVLQSRAQDSELYRRMGDPMEREGFCAEFAAIDGAFPTWFIRRVNDIYGAVSESAGENRVRHYY